MITIQRLNPTEDFNRIFNNFMDAVQTRSETWEGWAPASDYLETENEVRLYLDLPGVKKENLDIQLKDSKTLIVQGERKTAERDEKVRAHRLERATGHFARAFRLPYEVDTNSITASFRDGELEIVLRKPEALKPRKIEIKSE
jgi:HSP20 family protein